MDDWSSFRTTTSEQQRLRAALSGFCESQDLPEEQRAAYTAYLRKRIRPAVEMLIREDDFSQLETYSADRMAVRCRPKTFSQPCRRPAEMAGLPHSPEPELTGSDAGEYGKQKNRSCGSKRKVHKRKRSAGAPAFRRSPQKPLLAVPGTW